MQIQEQQKGLTHKRVVVSDAYMVEQRDVLNFAVRAAGEKIENLFDYSVSWNSLSTAVVMLYTA